MPHYDIALIKAAVNNLDADPHGEQINLNRRNTLMLQVQPTDELKVEGKQFSTDKTEVTPLEARNFSTDMKSEDISPDRIMQPSNMLI